MNFSYFDTSALLKQYVTETGSPWVQAYISASAELTIFTSTLTAVEATCAFSRRLRDGTLTPEQYATVLKAFEYDITHRYNLLDVESRTLESARRLAKKHPLRAYDAVQLSTAWLIYQHLNKNALTFICADDRLLNIAKAEGMKTDNPNDHP